MVSAVVSLWVGGQAQAATLDLTSTSLDTIVNGARIQAINTDISGEGTFVTIVQLFKDHLGNEKGYNTSGTPKPFDEGSSPTFNHNLLTSDTPIVTVGGIDYREFFLDLNQLESSAVTKQILMTGMQIYQSNTGSITSTTISSLGTLVWSLPVGTDLLLTQFLSGGGRDDYRFLIPNSLFSGLTYTYLYSSFTGANGGFDAWAIKTENNTGPTTDPSVPLPAAVWMGMALLGGAFLKRSRIIG